MTMTPAAKRGAVMLFSVAMALAGGGIAAAQSSFDGYHYQPDKITVGSVYHYVKSNQDGTRRGNIALYVADKDTLASFKYHPGGGQASYVTAEMDWSIYCARRFESYRVRAGADRQVVARLEFDKEKRVVTFDLPGSGNHPPVSIDHVPFHLWDFDFASLNFVMRHRRDPQKSFSIGVADPTYNRDTPMFVYRGEVDIAYAGEERRQDVTCRKYRIDGPGLENRGGWMWVDKAREHVVEFEIDLPDEPGFKDVRLVLEKVEVMDHDAWEAFVQSRLTGTDSQW